MKLNTRMRYGTSAMVDLARRSGEGMVSLGEIAQSQEISVKYLESLFAALHTAGLVRSQRGPQGGYVLARPPETITLREIYGVLESPDPYVPCTRNHSLCHRWAGCVTQEVWAEMYAASMQVLQATTLADLVARDSGRRSSVLSYDI